MDDNRLDGLDVLVVDDELVVRDLLSRWLEAAGARSLGAGSLDEALERFEHSPADAVVCDLRMPGGSGLELLRTLKRRAPDLPFLLMTGAGDLGDARSAMRHGADDLLAKPFEAEDLLGSLGAGLARKRRSERDKLRRRNLEVLVGLRTAELEAAKAELEHLLAANRAAHLESVIVLAKIVEHNDEETGDHIRRVSELSRLLAAGAGLDDEAAEEIAVAAPLHDIGKISIDPAILQKRGRLEAWEFEQMKAHTVRGAEILSGAEFLTTARDVALSHHERFDGGGYPHGLVGEEIPLSARIVAVADVFDALTTRRCYKPAWTVDRTLAYVLAESGRHFDPRVVRALSDSEPELRALCERRTPTAAPVPAPGPLSRSRRRRRSDPARP